jgi:hypothetical protein
MFKIIESLFKIFSSLILWLLIFYSMSMPAKSVVTIGNARQDWLSFSSERSSREHKKAEDTGRPPNRTSGGSRSPCSDRVIALVPGSNKIEAQKKNCSDESESSLTLTLADLPTFWFYVPKFTNPKLTAEFVLLDRQEQAVDLQTILLPGKPGVVGIRLNRPLQNNEQYRWQFSILTNPQSPSQNPTVEGLVKRITPESNLANQLKAIDSQQERIAIYSREGIWQDTLTSLAQLRLKYPTDATITADWDRLLETVGLKAIADAPLLDCCTVQKALQPIAY